MTLWLPWRRQVARADEAVKAAEELRDHAEEQQRQVEEIAPRVEAVAASLRRLRSDNHFGPMIDSLLRGGD